EGFDGLLQYLGCGKTIALIGSSGVGKSTLLNRLLGQDRQQVSDIRASDDRGRHTTTHREMAPLSDGTLVIDNPGMRELQLWDEGDLDATFIDVAELAQRCRFRDCSHGQEPGCAVRQAIAAGLLDDQRLGNFRKLAREAAFLDSRRDADAARERK